MIKHILVVACLAGVFFLLFQAKPSADQTASRLNGLEMRIGALESKIRDVEKVGFSFFLFGAFCALWAQNTGRNAWLWFFLGFFFSVITVIFLLSKNSEDLKKARELINSC